MLSIFLHWPNVSPRIFKRIWTSVKKAEMRALKLGWLNLNPFASDFKVSCDRFQITYFPDYFSETAFEQRIWRRYQDNKFLRRENFINFATYKVKFSRKTWVFKVRFIKFSLNSLVISIYVLARFKIRKHII